MEDLFLNGVEKDLDFGGEGDSIEDEEENETNIRNYALGDINQLRTDLKRQGQHSMPESDFMEDIEENADRNYSMKGDDGPDAFGTKKHPLAFSGFQAEDRDPGMGAREKGRSLLAQASPESKYLKYIDICLDRDDLFEIEKKEFNDLFDIEPPQNFYDKEIEDKNLTAEQKDVLEELYEFSAYLKRDIQEENRLLKYELDFFQHDFQNDYEDEASSCDDDEKASQKEDADEEAGEKKEAADLEVSEHGEDGQSP